MLFCAKIKTDICLLYFYDFAINGVALTKIINAIYKSSKSA